MKHLLRIGKSFVLFHCTNMKYLYMANILKRMESSAVSQESVMNFKNSLMSDIENKKIIENIPYGNPLSSKTDDEFIDMIAPLFGKALCLAPFVNHSKTLQKLIALGVDLSKVEKKGCAEFLLRSDFDRDLKKYIFFLHEIGIKPQELGHFLTKNPLIFQESVDNLKVRIDYLKSKNFSKNIISHILNSQPKLLMLNTFDLDQRLGFLQRMFLLKGKEVRRVIIKEPGLVLQEEFKIKLSNFIIKEEMGFSDYEIKELLLKAPRLWLIRRKSLLERFDFLHNTMGISHSQIVFYPEALFSRLFNLRERHLYLCHLHRAQYDPKKPEYVSLKLLTTDTDQEFCEKAAHTCVEEFNKFLKTL